jgi:mono/diheme cytochrome c family protein
MQDLRILLLFAAATISLALPVTADQAAIDCGIYLVSVAGCGDCHTPGSFLGQPGFGSALAGSELGAEIPGLGALYCPNPTPDPETGLGRWSEAVIVAAFTTGVRLDRRVLAPAMPSIGDANFTRDDAGAIAAFLKSVLPASNQVAGPFGPHEGLNGFVMRVIPPGG